MAFLTIQGGDYTINLAQVTGIEWTHDDQSAEVTLACGTTYTCEGEDYHAVFKMVLAHTARPQVTA